MITNDLFCDVRSLMDHEGRSYADLGLILGSSRQSVFSVLKNGVLSRQLIEIIEILGYKVEYCFTRGKESYSYMSVCEGVRSLMQKDGITFARLGDPVGCDRSDARKCVDKGILTPRLLGMIEGIGYNIELRYVRNIKREK